MQGNLVAEKIKIYPGVGTASLGATQHVAIKLAGNIQIGDIERKVK